MRTHADTRTSYRQSSQNALKVARVEAAEPRANTAYDRSDCSASQTSALKHVKKNKPECFWSICSAPGTHLLDRQAACCSPDEYNQPSASLTIWLSLLAALSDMLITPKSMLIRSGGRILQSQVAERMVSRPIPNSSLLPLEHVSYATSIGYLTSRP